MGIFSKQDPMNDIPGEEKQVDPSLGKFKYFIFVAAVVFMVMFLGAAFVFLSSLGDSSQPKKKPQKQTEEKQATTTKWAGLPGGDVGNGNGKYASTSLADVEVEKLTFGKFYESNAERVATGVDTYELPVNVKIDVSNYYDVSRKMQLDPHLEELNQQGFSIVEQQNLPPKAGDDFFSVYRYLLEKEIPLVVTNDFILYYFQNYLKQTYKEIEQGAFYRNLWDINKELYNIALTRYKKTRSEKGLVNDPVLEAQRLELAYFAVGLRLLSPTQDQVVEKTELSEAGKFSEAEASTYSFRMPESLREDVDDAVELIKKASGEDKSPVFRYPRDYKHFKIPTDYQGNDKLHNFYLAIRWLNSVFPLHYKTEQCVNCLLDYNDWTINMIAAGYLSQDLYTNRDLRSKWAVIYKFISFFSGLRQDLTYLHYHEAYTELFGQDYDLARIYGTRDKREKNLSKVRDELRKYDFLAMEGAIPRNDPDQRPYIGMRMLQQDYWPNDYIFGQLTGPELTRDRSQSRRRATACNKRQSHQSYRCRGLGLDVVNLLNPFDLTREYFNENTDYSGYSARMSDLRRELSRFTKHTWNKNVYWFTLDIVDKLFRSKSAKQPAFARSSKWQKNKDVTTALGGWVNLHLPNDKFLNYYEAEGSNLTGKVGYNKYNYVEPDVNFINELLAKNKMLLDMMAALNVTQEAKAATVRLQEINKQLRTVAGIARKELANQPLDEKDHKFITDFVKRYTVKEKGNNQFKIKTDDNKALKPDIEGMRLLLLVYKHKEKGKKILAAGPIFNYQER